MPLGFTPVAYCSVSTFPSPADPIYVDESSAGCDNGLTWGDAYTNLKDAIDKSYQCPDAPVWVSLVNS